MRSLRVIYYRALILFLGLSFGGCASLPGTTINDIKDRAVAFASKGEGTPVIVLVGGKGRSMATWKPIFDSLSQLTTVFAYDRPGYGRSTAKKVPASAGMLAEQLRQNLAATDHNPPYLLIGHSAGGLYVNMFARMYPDEVAGVVLLDSVHPSLLEYFKNEQPLVYSAFVTTSAIRNAPYEAPILINAHTEFDKLAEFPEVSLVVLTAGKSSLLETSTMRRKWLEFQADLASMSNGSIHKVVHDSGHFIHKDKPQLVIEQIARLVKATEKSH